MSCWSWGDRKCYIRAGLIKNSRITPEEREGERRERGGKVEKESGGKVGGEGRKIRGQGEEMG